MKLPPALNKNIVVQSFDKETLIYDLVSNKALFLNETSTIIFQACDGKTTFEKVKTKYNFTDELIYLTLEQLTKEGLIENNLISQFSGLSRRELIKRAGLGSMAALPIAASLTAPKAIQAASTCNSGIACQCSGSTNCTTPTCGVSPSCSCINADFDENGRDCGTTPNPCIGTCR